MNAPRHIEQNTEKKKFDKRKFWNAKYNNKFRVQQWEERRQKYVMRKYHKELKKMNKSGNPLVRNDTENTSETETTTPAPVERISSLKAAQLEVERRKEEKRRQREERLQKQKEMQEALENYKKKKAEKFKKLSKKTKHGQPVMKDRIKLLFEEIQQKIANDP